MTPIRRAVQETLPDERGVFLRCDRGNALYVSNYPARTETQIDWPALGFHDRVEGGLAFLTPDGRWMKEFERWARERVSFPVLTEAVKNADFGGLQPEDMSLFVEGVKSLELRSDAAVYERAVRQRAAVCLRTKCGGAAITACALIADLMNEGGIKDED